MQYPGSEKMKFTPNISLGNVLTMIGIVGGVASFIYTQSIQIEKVNGRVSVIESRVTSMESDVKESLSEIKVDIKSIEALMLETIRTRPVQR